MNRILSLFVGALMLVSFCAVSVYASERTSLTIEVPVASLVNGPITYKGVFMGGSHRISHDASWYYSLGLGNAVVSERGDGKFADRTIDNVQLSWLEPGIEIPIDSAHHRRFLLAAMLGIVYWEGPYSETKRVGGIKIGFAFGDDAWSAAVSYRYVPTDPVGPIGITSVAFRFPFK